MTPLDTSTISGNIGGIAAGLFAVVFLFKKLLTGIKADSAENSVIGLMHSELERMSEQNTTLSVELGKLQQDLIELNQELRKLSSENQRLHSEVVALTAEVTRLRATLREKV
jgi:predicted nuclease with TOPRIM domain